MKDIIRLSLCLTLLGCTSAQAYVGARTVTNEDKKRMVTECQAKKDLVFTAEATLKKAIEQEISKIIPGISWKGKDALSDAMLKKYKFSNTQSPLGVYVNDLRVQLPKTEKDFLDKTDASLEDATYYGTMCGGTSSNVKSLLEQYLTSLEPHVNRFLSQELCPNTITLDQFKEIKKNNFVMIGGIKMGAGKSIPSSVFGLFSSKPKVEIAKIRSYAETISCDYNVNQTKINFNLYYMIDLNKITSVKFN